MPTAALVQGENKSLAGSSSARKRPSVLRSDWLQRPSLEERNACTAYRRTQEILARNRSVNLLGFRDAVTVELWNSRNRVQIDRPGHEVFCRGEREQADTSAPSSRLSRVTPLWGDSVHPTIEHDSLRTHRFRAIRFEVFLL